MFSSDRCSSNVGLYLTYVSGDIPLFVKYSFSLINHERFANNKTNSWEASKKEFTTSKGWGSKFISHDELYENENQFFPKGKLRFIVKVVMKNVIDSTITLSRSSQLLQKLYETELNSDIVIRTSDDENLPAHKAILAASSEVFGVMFSESWAESKSNVVNASDLHSKVVQELLRFIYCEPNEVKIDWEYLIDLYYAAEKYHFDELKTICVKTACDKLDADNALQLIQFAEKFNFENLFSCCVLIIFA